MVPGCGSCKNVEFRPWDMYSDPKRREAKPHKWGNTSGTRVCVGTLVPGHWQEDEWVPDDYQPCGGVMRHRARVGKDGDAQHIYMCEVCHKVERQV